MNKVHFKSSDREWETPDAVFQPLKKEFNILIDVCANAENTKCKTYFDRKLNGLTANWAEKLKFVSMTIVGNREAACWMNPPYGRGIDKWIKKAYDESLRGVTTVALIPARTDTSWFHNYIHDKQEVRFIKGRIKFVDAESSAPFPSMIVIFRPKTKIKPSWYQRLLGIQEITINY
jgi:site-specific DNA-methyltransferase (adenine-specific)